MPSAAPRIPFVPKTVRVPLDSWRPERRLLIDVPFLHRDPSEGDWVDPRWGDLVGFLVAMNPRRNFLASDVHHEGEFFEDYLEGLETDSGLAFVVWPFDPNRIAAAVKKTIGVGYDPLVVWSLDRERLLGSMRGMVELSAKTDWAVFPNPGVGGDTYRDFPGLRKQVGWRLAVPVLGSPAIEIFDAELADVLSANLKLHNLCQT